MSLTGVFLKKIFKGGTSLSKVFDLIQRFSEDIDLILDWNEVVKDDLNLERSKTKQDKFNKSVSVLSHPIWRKYSLMLSSYALARSWRLRQSVLSGRKLLFYMQKHLDPKTNSCLFVILVTTMISI